MTDSTKFDWYQSDSTVCINYLKKNLEPSTVKVDFHNQAVSIYLLTPMGDELLKSFNLAYPIVTEKCSYRVSAMKIELRLQKTDDRRWDHLESDMLADKSGSSDDTTKTSLGYPSSSKVAHDWDKLEKEAAEIEDETDPLTKLFQNVYAGANDETRKAMIKSFTESGGTVLSTNWSEVGKEKVEVKPPDGMEYKNYEI